MDRLYTPWRYAYISGAEGGHQRAGVPEKLAAWPGDQHCVFCNMLAAADWAIAGGMPAAEAEEAVYLITRRKHCFVVLNAFPYSNGHLMAVPYAHAASLAALPAATTAEMMATLCDAERALRATYAPDGLNMGLNLGEAAGAGVAGHVHFHALPRWAGDGNFMSVVAETRVLPEMLAESWRRLRATFAGLQDETRTS